MRLQLVIIQFEQRTRPIVNQTDHTIEMYRQTAGHLSVRLVAADSACATPRPHLRYETYWLIAQLAGHRPTGSVTVLYSHVVHFHCSLSIGALCNRPVLTN